MQQQFKYNSSIKSAKVKFNSLKSPTQKLSSQNFNEIQVDIQPQQLSYQSPISLQIPRYSYIHGLSRPIQLTACTLPYIGPSIFQKYSIGTKFGHRLMDSFSWFFRLDFKPLMTIVNENSPSWKVLFPSIEFQNGRKKLGPGWWTHLNKTKIRIETDQVPRPRLFTNDESNIMTRNLKEEKLYSLSSE